MIVHYNNDLWELDIPFQLFESLKKTNPTFKVELLELTKSTFKRKQIAPIKDVEDYSIMRNLNALKK